MEKLFRVLDANVNRAAEGLRVLDDLARFSFDNRELSERIKALRHAVRKSMMPVLLQCLQQRDSQNDLGLAISQAVASDNKASLWELVIANFKRCQEALRVIEEDLKVLGYYQLSKRYEEYRFLSYSLEKDFGKALGIEAKRRKLATDLYCITASEYSKGRDNLQVVREMLAAGVQIIQYREKEKTSKDKYTECLKIRELTEAAGVTFIVNDDVDLALLVKADGIHLGQDDLPVDKVRGLVGDSMIIGLSTHSPEQAEAAVRQGVDYIGVGPIYKTFTKKDVCDPVGLGYLDYVVNNIKLPFVAIGGIKEHNLADVIAHGAKCVALVTEIVGADDIAQKIVKLREVIHNSR
ncbi:MAG TPA: thiamine phosphate synthase [Bacillota bacterium]|nr:thiamine phosphate synthase [Bacillota bacterium]HOL10073.1 thiamine phosphate synthase [Bacillota bacterium]HPO98343.1 thiamine phosphate synthase [Bacillota bacterium]